MKYIAFGVITGVAGLIAWLLLVQPECSDGAVVADESACLRVAGFDRMFCASAFARPEEAIFRAGNVYQTLSDCQKRFTTCIDSPGAHGYTPKSSGYCLVRAADGALASMRPVYGLR